ncbi:MAG: hypothetical protein K8T20_15100 [Planctomycetes bacterium]|nr:hypothetical protein [Planctomycetota bacterium]
MLRDTLDLSYDLDLVLDEIERAISVADDSGYAAAVTEIHETTEREGLLQRAKRSLQAVTAWVF